MYKIVDIFSEKVTPEQIAIIERFCHEAVAENKHASRENMLVNDWESNPASLLYLLLKEQRFSSDKGALQLLYKEDELIAISGYYQSSFDPNIYIMGVRSWVLKKHRFGLAIATWLLPHQLKNIKQRRAHTALISFNEANKAFAQLIERANSTKSETKFFFGDHYPEIYKDMVFIEFPVNIKNVKQWILVKYLSTFVYDWSSIRWKE